MRDAPSPVSGWVFDAYSSGNQAHDWATEVTWNYVEDSIYLGDLAIKDDACDSKGADIDIAAGSIPVFQYFNKGDCGSIQRYASEFAGHATYTDIRVRACEYSSTDAEINCGSWIRINEP